MTVINASSPCCGDVKLSPSDVHLVICPAREDEVRSFYTFRCVGMTVDGVHIPCDEQINKPAPMDVIALLRSGGVRVLVVEPETHEGDALTEDDLIVLGQALEQEGCDIVGMLEREGSA